MANDNGIKLSLWQFVSICIALVPLFTGTIYTAFAQQSQKDDIIEIKTAQEKKHDKIDKKFEKLIDAMTVTNLKLERIATKLEKE